MERTAQQPEPSQATAYLDVDGNVTCGVPENCEIKRRTSFSHKRIGVCVLIFDPKRGFVVGKRKGSHGAGKWATPGGHTELEETLQQCVIREVTEETSLNVNQIQFLEFTHDNFIDPPGPNASLKNYITSWWIVRLVNATDNPENMEENKCEGWEWKTFAELWETYKKKPQDLFLPLQHLFDCMPNWYDEVMKKYDCVDHPE